VLCACLAPLLTNCGTSDAKRFVAVSNEIIPIPRQLKACFAKQRDVVLPKGDWSKEQVTAIVGKLKRREIQLGTCGEQLIALYESQERGLKRR
jgi:hypothetical protein